MKKNLFIALFLGLYLWTNISCDKGTIEPHQGYTSFLEELRPHFFDALNFNKDPSKYEIQQYLNDFTKTYIQLEEKFNAGEFTSYSDLENMRLAAIYYSFYIHAITKAYLDGFITFGDIIKNEEIGSFSGVNQSDPDFKHKELTAMMERANAVALLAVNINGYDDRAYGFYIAVKQIYERLNDPLYNNNPITQDSMIQYLDSTLSDYTFFSQWNVLMTLLYFDNYEDPLNTFKNPQMDIVLDNVINRIKPQVLPEENINFIGILGPMYQFDLVLKKLDWLLQEGEPIMEEEKEEIMGFISRLETIDSIIMNERTALLNTWEYKNSYYARTEILDDTKLYITEIAEGNLSVEKPDFRALFNLKSFRQAYQCYSCHNSPDL